MMPDFSSFAGLVFLSSLVLIVGTIVVGWFWARDHLVKDWMPALITGLLLISIIPFANEIYWKRQKEFERCVQDRDKRYELLSSTARTYTNLFKVHTQLFFLSADLSRRHGATRTVEGRHKTPQLSAQDLAALAALLSQRGDLLKERIRLESQLGADSALMNRYLPSSAAGYNTLAEAYDNQVTPTTVFHPTREHPLVQEAQTVIAALEREARTRECN